MICQCKVCTRHREWEDRVSRLGLNAEQRLFVDELYSNIASAETEADWLRANLEGSWPLAVENMSRWGWAKAKETK